MEKKSTTASCPMNGKRNGKKTEHTEKRLKGRLGGQWEEDAGQLYWSEKSERKKKEDEKTGK